MNEQTNDVLEAVPPEVPARRGPRGLQVGPCHLIRELKGLGLRLFFAVRKSGISGYMNSGA